MAVEDRVAYHVCRRCTLIIVDGRFRPDTILHCRDCWDEEKIEVKMKFVPISPR